ncbi:hypothetical protein [Thalassorhabdomicrobium marinisediminis]|uniref:hypothetical protein n=1 Tax=Thalassorhabdomicrobium marinisediminis TaxID=2170577 RepID=UPI002491CFF7|nr:hypothetical protein [Thalassorhabdomicrobium marinisediminis]
MTPPAIPPMPPPRRRTEFLDRGSYRQRRLRDAARLMPVLGAVLMALPLMWPRDRPDQSLTSSGIIYLFGLWAILVVLAFMLSRLLRYGAAAAPGGDAER